MFFDNNRRVVVKKQLGLEGKKVFAYLPPYRGNIFSKKNAQEYECVKKYLYELDKYLKDDQVLILKLHLYNNITIDCSQYKLSGNMLEATLKPYSWNMFRIKIQSV